jgi:hypothetical protein
LSPPVALIDLKALFGIVQPIQDFRVILSLSGSPITTFKIVAVNNLSSGKDALSAAMKISSKVEGYSEFPDLLGAKAPKPVQENDCFLFDSPATLGKLTPFF